MENIVFGEALGEGAFGKVYVATVSNVVMQSSSISTESLNKYVKMGPRHDYYRPTALTMKAAVKILQGKLFQVFADKFSLVQFVILNFHYIHKIFQNTIQ